MKSLKLIACDLDGTLLLNGAQSLQTGTCSLIARLQSSGIRFMAASGRQYTNLQRLFYPVRNQIAYLCENGCLGFVNGKRIFRETMDHVLGQTIIRDIQSTDGAEVLLSGDLVSYIQPKNMDYYVHLRDVVKNDVELVPDILNTPESYMKISVYEPGGIRDETYWQDKYGSRCTVVTGGNAWLDMMPLGVNKATGLRQMLTVMGIDPQECMAIGDNDNDLEMLRMVGIPVAVRTAKPEVRKIAVYETDTVEHLFAQMLDGTLTFENML